MNKKQKISKKPKNHEEINEKIPKNPKIMNKNSKKS